VYDTMTRKNDAKVARPWWRLAWALCVCWAVACGEEAEPEPEPACEGPSDCAEGQTCEEGVCVDPLCVAGATRCEGAVLVTCEGGEREEKTRCEGGTTCALSDGAAACVAQVCTPNERRCVSETQASVCDEAGLNRQTVPCGDEELCTDGTCAPRDCGVFEVGCLDDQTAYTCDGAGRRTLLPCDEGKTCQNSVCSDQSCLPGYATCEGNVLMQCNEDGSSMLQVDCDEVETCVDAPNGCACVDGACVER
jgi:hypothetical protein